MLLTLPVYNRIKLGVDGSYRSMPAIKGAEGELLMYQGPASTQYAEAACPGFLRFGCIERLIVACCGFDSFTFPCLSCGEVLSASYNAVSRRPAISDSESSSFEWDNGHHERGAKGRIRNAWCRQSSSYRPCPTVKILERLPENHEAYALIGKVAATWAYLDHLLDVIIGDFIGGDKAKIACVTGRLSSPAQRCDAILRLCEIGSMPESIVKAAKAIKKDSHSIGNIRNRLSHDPTFVDQETGGIAQFRSLPNEHRVFGMVDIEPAKIIADLAEIIGVIQRADALREAIFTALSASGKKTL